MRLRRLLGVLLVFAGCSGAPGGSGLSVTVKFGPGSKSTCVIVGVQLHDSPQSFETMKPVTRGAKGQLVIGVEPSGALKGKVVPYVHGFAAADCSGSFVEEAVSTTIYDLGAVGVQQASLTLDSPAADGGTDAGSDAGTDAGSDAGCVPTTEVCTDGLDNDCNGLTDCLDPACATKTCNPLDPCVASAVCVVDGGCRGSPLCVNPGTCEVGPGACAAGTCSYDAGVGAVCPTGFCRSDKTCADAGSEVFCGNGLDDDTDTLTDCADPDCNAQACDAGPSTCFLGGTCASNACAKSNPVTCTPPSVCFVSAGACVEGVGCSFSAATLGTPCDGGTCQGDGGCAPPEICDNGVDDDGDGKADCVDPDCDTKTCNDNNVCTGGNTTCANFVCQGGSVLVGNNCPGGQCQSDAGCAPTPGMFPYPPSNFDPTLISNPDASVSINCLAQYDTNPGAPDSGFRAWCGPLPAVSVQNQTGGDPLVILSMNALSMTDGGSIYFIGTRPVALAVFGNATVAGHLIAGPAPGMNQAGAGASLGGPAAKPHCSTGTGTAGVSSNSTSAGGGGGAFGADGGNGGLGGNQATGIGVGGVSNGNLSLVPLRGGCAGGFGGTNTGAREPGAGGGALQVSVSGTLTVIGIIGAPGQAGLGPNVSNSQNGGGSGAGSGGGLLLEAESLVTKSSSILVCNGGGGGEGDGDTGGAGRIGGDGEDGHVNDVAVAQKGSGGSSQGGDGANGGVRATPAATGSSTSSSSAGGGGGGASVGRIRINVLGSCTADAGLVSPQPTGNCP